MKTPLIIIYNHRFDANIPKLEKIYAGRFSTIYHLVPFYDGDLPNVIPVFEQSFYFQGYIPQAIHKLKHLQGSHLAFIGDDLILHPSIDENNILLELNVSSNEGFLPFAWGSLSEISMEWANIFPSINAFYSEDLLLHHAPKWASKLPNGEEAKRKFTEHGFNTGKLLFKNLKKNNNTFNYSRRNISFKQYLNLFLKKRRTLPYPMLAAYSDIFIVSKESLSVFSEYCELFRQMRLWVEVALPTALLLSHEKVKFEKDSKWIGTTYWENSNIQDMKTRFEKVGFSLNDLLASYKSNELYIHPVKLSQWKK